MTQNQLLSEETDIKFGFSGKSENFSHFDSFGGCFFQILSDKKVET